MQTRRQDIPVQPWRLFGLFWFGIDARFVRIADHFRFGVTAEKPSFGFDPAELCRISATAPFHVSAWLIICVVQPAFVSRGAVGHGQQDFITHGWHFIELVFVGYGD
jgi:hypothetical protein